MPKAKLPSLGQISTWLDQGKYKKIKDAVEAVPEEQWTPEIKLHLAMAINNLADPGDPEGRKKLRRGLELLQSIEPEEAKLKDRYAFHFAMGFSWFFLDHRAEALPYFKRAAQFDPYDTAAKELLEMCQQATNRPKARWPFREGVWKAWEAFEEQQPDILKQLETEPKGRCSLRLERMVSTCMGYAFTKPACSVWKTDGKPVLVCSVVKCQLELVEILQLFQQAPADIREVWDFQIGPLPDRDSQAAQAFLRKYGDTPVHLFARDGTFVSATLLDTELCAYSADPMTDRTTEQFFASLRNHLGYLPFWQLMDPVPSKKDSPQTIPLRELSQTLTANGQDCSERNAEKMLELAPYKITGDLEGRKFWRQSNESGVARLSDLYDYRTREKVFTDASVRDGVECGYLVWPITGGFKKKVQEETVQFQVQIQGWLLEQLGAECYYPLGRATDVNFAYLDFIAWDLQPVLETAAKLLQKAGIPWAAYRPYRDSDPAISLYGFDAPPLQPQA